MNSFFIEDNHILSTQHIYGQFRGRKYMTKAGKDKKNYYNTVAMNQDIKYKPTCNLKLSIKLMFEDKRRRDVDNYNKIILDSLTGVVYNDDSQIVELTVSKEIVPKGNGGLVITIDYV